MPKSFNKILNYFLILFVFGVFASCAPLKKNPWMEKKKKASKVHASQLGRNKFYFSPGYQKKLQKSYKKK